MTCKTVLQFSGGQDSLAALYLLEPFWEGITVAWVHARDASEPLMRLMETLQDELPNFAVIDKRNASRYRTAHGDPTDATWKTCCAQNLWLPMYEWTLAHGVKYVVRGCKQVDPINLISPGHIDEHGIGYIFPVWGWTDEKVREYLVGKPWQPVYPHDCATCPVTKPCDRVEGVKRAA